MSTDPVPVDPASCLATLAAGVDAALVVAPVGDLACGAVLLEVLVQQERLSAAVHRLTARAERAGTAAADGAASLAAWLRWQARLAPGEAAGLVRTAHRLVELPDTRKAFEAGEISARHARAVTDLLRDVPVEEVRLTEPALLDLARAADPASVRHAAARVREAAFPDGTAEARRRLHEGRYVSLTEGFAGGFDLQGRLTPEAAAVVRAALAPFLTPAGPEDDRNAAQRRHDGLAELARLTLAGGRLPDSGGDRPRLTVTVDWATLAEPRPAGESDTTENGVTSIAPPHAYRGAGATAGSGRAMLGWAGPLDPAGLRRISCDAETVRVVFGPAGEVLDLGRTARLPSAAQRRALAARDGGCVFPGCDRPPGWCQAHHLKHWIDGGPTDLANLALLCGHHHHLLHEAGWRLAGDGDGGWAATAPDGRALHHRHRRRRSPPG